MSIIPITQYGDLILRKSPEKVKNVDDQLIVDIQDMLVTMRNANGIGLAGNQANLDKSLFVMDLQPVEGFEDTKPFIMINPEIISVSDETCFIEEGCLSLPRISVEVERPSAVQIKFIDTDEKEQIMEVDGYLARVIQHEYDHLIGKMIPDRVTPALKQKLKSELMKIMKRDVEVDYPITEKNL